MFYYISGREGEAEPCDGKPISGTSGDRFDRVWPCCCF